VQGAPFSCFQLRQMTFAWRAVKRHSPFLFIQKWVKRRCIVCPAKGALPTGVILSDPITITVLP